MASKPLVHRGSSSWWSGTFTTLCGQKFPLKGSKNPWFTNPRCPACEAIHRANGGK
ncbi:hypothetical protein [Amycolatopsis jiangsuensis]|uniref:Uncharacterized protein n=1 Tax=Amycolatopsis jiangsuensis TaxID=1181879 RepID=A0A840IZI2_9PSEU|nr:hypothetical protein [Amycolatopsis jiangsuensis]MBB4687230.1 hypothetical protein [Amycolatopsis jiangsuensis]